MLVSSHVDQKVDVHMDEKMQNELFSGETFLTQPPNKTCSPRNEIPGARPPTLD